MADQAKAKEAEEAPIMPDVVPADIAAQNARDNEELLRLGKKPVLERFLGFFTLFGIVSITSVAWQTVILLLSFNTLQLDSEWSMYGYAAALTGIIASSTTIGELTSMTPTSGGQHHWVSILAPKNSQTFFSYITGWLTMIGWQAGTAVITLMSTHAVQALLLLTRPGHQIKLWQTSGIFVTLLGLANLFSVFGSSWVSPARGSRSILELISIMALIFTPVCCYPGAGFDWGDKILVLSAPLWSIESVPTWVKMSGFAAAAVVRSVISSCGLSPMGISKASAYITSIIGQESGATKGILVLAGVVGPALALVGVDGAVHLSEETLNPSNAVPKAMLLGSVLNGLLGLATIAGASFGLKEITAVSASPSLYAITSVFEQLLRVRGGVVLMSFMVGHVCIDSVFGSVAIATRHLWALARDRGVGGWRWIEKADDTYALPYAAGMMTFLASLVLGFGTIGALQYLGSTEALKVMISLTVGGLYLSYLLSSTFLLYRRITGQIHPREASATRKRAVINTTGAKSLTWGTWHVPEPLGTIVNLVSVAYLTSTLAISFLPINQYGQLKAGINYGGIILGGTLVSLALSYVVVGRKDYKGPVVQIRATKK